jgi:hypothetical protein
VYVFTYRTQDAAGGLSAPVSVTLRITTPDIADFVAVIDNGIAQFVTEEDTPLIIDAATGPVGPVGIGVLANDQHPGEESAPVTLIVVSEPFSGGTVVFDAANNGGFIYTPGENFDGIDTFSYRVHDGYTLSNVATVNIVVNSVDDPPQATDDFYELDTGAVLVVDQPQNGLLANDFDPDGDTLEDAVLVAGSGPMYGVLELSSDGTFTYTPGAGFPGQDTFQYTVGAAGARSAPAEVRIGALASCALGSSQSSDGSVGLEDLAILVGQFGRGGTEAAAGDLDCDGVVGLRDIIMLRNRLINAVTKPSQAASVIAAYGGGDRELVQPEKTDEGLVQLVRETSVAALRRPHTAMMPISSRVSRRLREAAMPLSKVRSQLDPVAHAAVFANWITPGVLKERR